MNTELYDALTLEINRADALACLLMDRLEALSDRPDTPTELAALSLVAESVSDKLQLILEKAHALHKGPRPSPAAGDDTPPPRPIKAALKPRKRRRA